MKQDLYSTTVDLIYIGLENEYEQVNSNYFLPCATSQESRICVMQPYTT